MAVKLEGNPDFLVFLDNVRVDKFVKGFNTSTSINSQINEAAIELIHIKELDEAFDYLSNVRIFVKNMFTGKYLMVFDGEVNARSFNYSPEGSTISFAIRDNMTWLLRLMFPIYFSPKDKLLPRNRFIWSNYDLDADSNMIGLTTSHDAKMAGKNIQEMKDTIYSKMRAINRSFGDPESAVSWARLPERTVVMSDINKSLTDDQGMVLDLLASGSQMDNVYTFLVDLLSKLSFEFFQDRDGVMRIKQPFWVEGIPLNHVIDPVMIMGFSESTRFSDMPTRVIASGYEGRFLERAASTPFGQELYVPIASYLGPPTNLADNVDESTPEGSWVGRTDIPVVPQASLPQQPASTAGFFVDRFEDYDPADPNGVTSRVVSGGEYGSYRGKRADGSDWFHTGLDIAMVYGTPVRAQGNLLEVIEAGPDATYGLHIITRCLDAENEGTEILYAHLSEAYVDVGDRITGGTVIGLSGGKVDDPPLIRGMSTGPHLHMEVRPATAEQASPLTLDRYGRVHPTLWLGYRAGRITTPIAYRYGVAGNTTTTPREKRYGLNVYRTAQPLIRGDNPEKSTRLLNQYAAYIYHVMNAATNTASLSMVGAPWIRPGFNLWVDPSGYDKVYYVTSVNHTGSADGGVFTSVALMYGRDRRTFVLNKSFDIGKNIFVNDSQGSVRPEQFGKTVAGSNQPNARGEMANVALELDNFRDVVEREGVVIANRSPYRKYYGEGANNERSEIGTYLNEWSFEYTPEEIQNMLNALYDQPYTTPDNASDMFRESSARLASVHTPDVIKQRAQRTASKIAAALEKAVRYYLESK